MRFKWIYFIVFMLTCALLIPGPGLAVAADPGMLIERPQEDPNIRIGRDMKIPEYNAGERVSLSIPVDNLSGTAAKNFVISVDINDPQKFPFEIDKMSFSRELSYLGGNSRQLISFYATVPLNTEPGVYPIAVNAVYTTDYGAGGSASGTIYIKIVNDHKQPALKLSGVEFPGDRLPSGKSSIIKLMLKNEGDLSIKDVEVHLSGFTTNGINLDKWNDTQSIKSIKAQEIKPVEFKIYIDPELESGTYTLDLTLTYQDEYDLEYTKEGKVYLPVNGKGDKDDLTPRIILDNYYYDGAYVTAGENFPLTMSFINTSEVTTVKNIKISLSSEGDVFCPVGSSNSFFIKAIEPGVNTEETIVFKPKVNAECQTYNINVDIDYQDGDGNKYNEKELISIPVMQDTTLNISAIEVPPDSYVGEPTSVSVDFYNTGRALIRNLKIRTKGDFEIRDGDIYIGNLEAGKDDYYDVTIIPNKEGKVAGKIIFEYDDDSNLHYITEKNFSLKVMQPEAPVDFDMPQENQVPDKNKNNWLKWIIPAAGLLLLVPAVVVIVRKRRLKKQEEVDFDE